MKRYMELIRRLLAHIEQGNLTIPEWSDYTPKQVHYHIGLCYEAGYIDVEKAFELNVEYQKYRILRLLWDGHNALDELRHQLLGVEC